MSCSGLCYWIVHLFMFLFIGCLYYYNPDKISDKQHSSDFLSYLEGRDEKVKISRKRARRENTF